jgi:hypothetical protein
MSSRPHLRTTSSKITQAVLSRGEATTDDIQEMFPQHGRDYLLKALCNAKSLGLIRLVRRGVGSPAGGIPGLWAAPLKGGRERPLVASVWELGTPRTEWPELPAGRVYRPLGEWNTEEAAA